MLNSLHGCLQHIFPDHNQLVCYLSIQTYSSPILCTTAHSLGHGMSRPNYRYHSVTLNKENTITFSSCGQALTLFECESTAVLLICMSAASLKTLFKILDPTPQNFLTNTEVIPSLHSFHTLPFPPISSPQSPCR